MGNDNELCSPWANWSQLDYKKDMNTLRDIWKQNQSTLGNDEQLFLDCTFDVLQRVNFWSHGVDSSVFSSTLLPGRYLVFIDQLQNPEVDIALAMSWMNSNTPLLGNNTSQP